MGSGLYWQYVAQVAALYKSRKDACKEKCRVWGIISNATHWKFISINDQGQLSESKEYVIELYTYGKEAEFVYRLFTILSLFASARRLLRLPRKMQRSGFASYRRHPHRQHSAERARLSDDDWDEHGWFSPFDSFVSCAAGGVL